MNPQKSLTLSPPARVFSYLVGLEELLNLRRLHRNTKMLRFHATERFLLFRVRKEEGWMRDTPSDQTVCWWAQAFICPSLIRGQHQHLHLRAANQRAAWSFMPMMDILLAGPMGRILFCRGTHTQVVILCPRCHTCAHKHRANNEVLDRRQIPLLLWCHI